MSNYWSMAGTILGILSFVGGLMAWFVRVTVRSEILEATEKLLLRINGTYTRSAGSTLSGSEIQRDLAASVVSVGALRVDLKELADYSHAAVHDLRNRLQLKTLMREFQDLEPRLPPNEL